MIVSSPISVALSHTNSCRIRLVFLISLSLKIYARFFRTMEDRMVVVIIHLEVVEDMGHLMEDLLEDRMEDMEHKPHHMGE